MNLERIEPLSKLGIVLKYEDAERAEFSLPLMGNRNDKGSVFAGSQYSALVVCGWYMAGRWAQANGLGDKIAIKDSNIIYPSAAFTDLTVTATFDTPPDLRPSGHWRACITVDCLDTKEQLVSRLTGDYRVLVG